MKRYCISPITGDGTITNPYRASVADVSGVNTASLIPSNADGTPKYRFAFCQVAAAQFTNVLAVTNLYLFPDYNLDGRMDGMEAQARADMVQSVQAYDLDGNGLHLDATNADSDSYRAVVNKIGRQIEPVFDCDHFGPAEVSQ